MNRSRDLAKTRPKPDTAKIKRVPVGTCCKPVASGTAPTLVIVGPTMG